jgi:hypothetical protein
VDRHPAIVEDPLSIAEHAVYAPVDEHAKFCILKFLPRLQVFGGGLISGLSHGWESCEGRGGGDEDRHSASITGHSVRDSCGHGGGLYNPPGKLLSAAPDNTAGRTVPEYSVGATFFAELLLEKRRARMKLMSALYCSRAESAEAI